MFNADCFLSSQIQFEEFNPINRATKTNKMQATIGCLSRIVSRTLVNNAVNGKEASSPSNSLQTSCPLTTSASAQSISTAAAENCDSGDEHARLLTAVSGFPKSQGSYNIDHILKGQIGDDAYFTARHVDDWTNSGTLVGKSVPIPTRDHRASSPPSPLSSSPSTVPSATSLRSRINSHRRNSSGDEVQSVEQLLNPLSISGNSSCTSNVSSSFNGLQNSSTSSRLRHRSSNSADVIGVADGVGGWRQYGIDPGQFSFQLMQSCERLVKSGYFVSNQPARLLAQGFSEMQQCKKPVIGSSTACLAMLSHADGKLYSANIGDSGLLVVRDGEVVHRSSEQQHYFNTPFQLSLPPSEMASDVLSDRPEAADRYEFNVEDGDVILLATDGVFDNVPDALLVEQISSIKGCTDDLVKIQQCCNSLAFLARQLSRDENFLSPFAKNARRSGYADVSGGKEDDVTVLLAAVNRGNNYNSSSR